MNKRLNQYKTHLIIAGLFLAAALGLGLGYLIFQPSPVPLPEGDLAHVHEAEETIWTCSMHPQIRQNEPGSCPICGMELIPLEENTSSDPLILEMTTGAVKLAQIETTVIGKSGTAEKILSLSGKIQEDERLAASQVAHIPGRIEKLFVSFEGEYVRRGQKIAKLYSPELITAQQELIQANKLKDRNPGLLTSAKQKLVYWKLSEAQIKAMEESDSIQETFDIYADASGVVTTRRVSVGDYVKLGGVLFDLVNLNRVWVLFDAYEEDLAQIKLGDDIRFTTPSVPGKNFSTRVSFIDPVINPRTRVASIRGEVSNANRTLKPEMFVRGELLSSSSEKEQLLLPKSAVLWTGKRSVVYVQVPNMNVPSFRYQEVELGERVGNSYLVKNGLQAGDEVVSYGSFSIDAAAQLNNQQSMMNRLVGNAEDKVSDLPDFTTLTSPMFKDQLSELLAAYFPLKDALIQSNAQVAMKQAQIFLSGLENIDMSLVKGEIHAYWMQQAKALKNHAGNIVSGEELAEQRNQFSFLSSGLIEAVQVLGIKGDTVFIQHCPMAMNNQGANWLSLQEEIRNPYFGDKMLSCGSVTQQLPALFQKSETNPNQFHNH